MNNLKYLYIYFFHQNLFCIRTVFLIAAMGSSLNSAWAQSSERFTFDYLHFADADNVEVSTMSGSFSHRFFLDKDGTNLLTLSIAATQVDLLDENQTEPDRSRQLRAIVPEINLLKVLNENYSLVATLRPGFFGDLTGSLSDQFRLEGGFVITKFINENLTLGLGLGRGTNFGRDLVVPLVQFLYFASDKIVLRGVLPVNASAWYIPSQKWEFGISYKLQGSMFNLDETNIAGAERIGFAAAQVGLGTRYKVAGNNFLTAEIGYTVLRRYEWDDENGTSTDIGQEPFVEREVDPVPYINIGFSQKF
jgi:hypothetical protein